MNPADWATSLRASLRDQRFRLTRTAERFDLDPARAAAVYVVFGVLLWIVSDIVFPRVIPRPILAEVQAAKALVEVAVGAAFILVVTAASRHRLQRVNARLVRQQEELDVLHRVLRHNLRNRLNVVAGNASIIANRVSDPEVLEACAAIDESTQDVIDSIERAKQIRRISESDPQARVVDVVETVRLSVERVEADLPNADVTADLPDRAYVEGNHMLPQAVEELVRNAVVHNGADAPRVSVAVSVVDGGETVEIAVCDEGPGIPDDVREVVLCGAGTDLTHLSGLGLWIVYWTVEYSDGDLHIDADEDGTTVRMRFPMVDPSEVDAR